MALRAIPCSPPLAFKAASGPYFRESPSSTVRLETAAREVVMLALCVARAVNVCAPCFLTGSCYSHPQPSTHTKRGTRGAKLAPPGKAFGHVLQSSSGGQARPGYPLPHATTFTQVYHQMCAEISGVTRNLSTLSPPFFLSESWNLRGGRGDALHRVRPRGCCGFWGRRWGRLVERFGDVHEPLRVHANAGEDTGVGGAQELCYREEVTDAAVFTIR